MKIYYITWRNYDDGQQDNVMYFSSYDKANKKSKELHRLSIENDDIIHDCKVEVFTYKNKAELIERLNKLSNDHPL